MKSRASSGGRGSNDGTVASSGRDGAALRAKRHRRGRLGAWFSSRAGASPAPCTRSLVTGDAAAKGFRGNPFKPGLR